MRKVLKRYGIDIKVDDETRKAMEALGKAMLEVGDAFAAHLEGNRKANEKEKRP